MDTFIEKIVAKRRTVKDFLIAAGLVLATIILIPVVTRIPLVNTFTPIIAVGLIYIDYRLITSRSIEYEYAVTNGDLDIDTIIARRKRKRIFSANCKDFEIVARLKTNRDKAGQLGNIVKRIEAVSSMDSEDIFFVTLNYKGERTAVFFEPDERMIRSFKTFIPRKVFE
ncbi:MAG: DUF6106 family protein [Acetivibrionales bacterium]